MKVIFIFIDGLGIGDADPGKNPICAAHTPALNFIFENYSVIPTEVSLGVPGLPQSATGQTAIFTGKNAPHILGRHLSGQPTVTLKNMIYGNNLFGELIRRGLRVTSANTYRQEYLERMIDSKDRRHRPSVTSVMSMANGIPFRTIDDYRAGKGVYHDITGKVMQEYGYDVEPVTPEQAAGRLYSISREYDLTLYEHFLTDILGHKGNMSLAVEEIELLDAFLGGLLKHVDLQEDVVIITSDHGNIEDLSVKTHTFNRVPTILIGEKTKNITVKIESLTDIMPAVLELFDLEGKGFADLQNI